MPTTPPTPPSGSTPDRPSGRRRGRPTTPGPNATRHGQRRARAADRLTPKYAANTPQMRSDHADSPKKVTNPTPEITEIAEIAVHRHDQSRYHVGTNPASADSADRAQVVIPLPRRSPENADPATVSAPENGADQAEWRYHYHGKRGADVTFTGHVIPVGGREGERLLHELGGVVRELLEWAYHQQHDRADDSHGDDGRDGGDDQEGMAA